MRGKKAVTNAMTAADSNDFETQLLAMNFVFGKKYTFVGSPNISQIITYDAGEFLQHADVYNQKTNRSSTFSLFKIKLTPDVVKTVIFKEERPADKTVTYMFQKDECTLVKASLPIV